METLTVAKEIETISNITSKINKGIEAFENRKSELKALAEEAENLTIVDINDRDGYKEVSATRKELKQNRVEIQKEGKAMRAPLTEISRFVIDKEEELIAIIEPVENKLKEKEDWYNSEIDRVKEEKRRAEIEIINKRINALAELGFQVDIDELKIMTKDEFSELLAVAKEEFMAAQEKKRLQEEEFERKRLSMEAEKKAFEEAKAKLEEERLAKAKAEAEARAKVDEERRKLEEERRAFEESKRKAEEEAKAKAEAEQLEKERLAEIERMKPDYEKLVSYLTQIKSIKVPEVKTEKAKLWVDKLQSIIEVATESLHQLKK